MREVLESLFVLVTCYCRLDECLGLLWIITRLDECLVLLWIITADWTSVWYCNGLLLQTGRVSGTAVDYYCRLDECLVLLWIITADWTSVWYCYGLLLPTGRVSGTAIDYYCRLDECYGLFGISRRCPKLKFVVRLMLTLLPQEHHRTRMHLAQALAPGYPNSAFAATNIKWLITLNFACPWTILGSAVAVLDIVGDRSSVVIIVSIHFYRVGSMLPWATWRRMTGGGTCMTLSRVATGWETKMPFTI